MEQLEPFDMSETIMHMGAGSTITPSPNFGWGPDFGERYRERFGDDLDDARIVTLFPQTADWEYWERHPGGEELVLLVSGKVRLFQEHEGVTREVVLTPGLAVVNPPGAWHTADVLEPGLGVFVTPSGGTDHKPR